MTSDDIHAYVQQLEADVVRKDRTIENLLEQMEEEQEPDARDTFIDLITQDVEFYEINYDRATERMKRVVDAYRACRPKGTPQSVY